MILIDCHVHIFKKFSGVLNNKPVKSKRFGKIIVDTKITQFLPPSFENSNSRIETYINYMDCHNVTKAILMPNYIYGFHNEYFDEILNRYNKRFKAVALIDISKGKEEVDKLKDLVINKDFLGLKIDTGNILNAGSDFTLLDVCLKPFFSICNKFSKAIFLHLAKSKDIESLKKIIETYKEIKYIICHFGAEASFSNYTEKKDYFNNLLKISSQHLNVFFETSAVFYYINDTYYPFLNTCKLIEKVYEKLGPEKILWGSDYPGTLNIATYKQLIDYIIRGCTKIKKKHMEMIMGKNALELFW